jgi:hypothetical protein
MQLVTLDIVRQTEAKVKQEGVTLVQHLLASAAITINEPVSILYSIPSSYLSYKRRISE